MECLHPTYTGTRHFIGRIFMANIATRTGVLTIRYIAYGGRDTDPIVHIGCLYLLIPSDHVCIFVDSKISLRPTINESIV